MGVQGWKVKDGASEVRWRGGGAGLPGLFFIFLLPRFCLHDGSLSLL